jgi:hypothetical protein
LPSSLTAKTQPAIHGGYFMAKAVLHDGKEEPAIPGGLSTEALKKIS